MKTKKDIIFLSVVAVIWGVWIYVFYRLDGSLSFGGIFMSLLLTGITLIILSCIKQIKWRIDNGVDVFATLETDVEKVKSHMLFIMQWGHSKGIEGANAEFNAIFRNYPQWELSKWVVFRSWYKYTVDFMLKYPEIYKLTIDGEPYRVENDSLYDATVPDWSLFDRDHSHDYDCDDDNLDDYDPFAEDRAKAERDSTAFGVGMIGLCDGLGIGVGSSDGSGLGGN